jgi:hypothetical protein
MKRTQKRAIDLARILIDTHVELDKWQGDTSHLLLKEAVNNVAMRARKYYDFEEPNNVTNELYNLLSKPLGEILQGADFVNLLDKHAELKRLIAREEAAVYRRQHEAAKP